MAFGCLVVPTGFGATGADTCGDANCYKTIAAATGTSHIVVVQLVVQDRDYQVTVQLVDGSTDN